jgi:hypothetical protein
VTTQSTIANSFPIVYGRCTLSKSASGFACTLATLTPGATGPLFDPTAAVASKQAGLGGAPPSVVARLSAFVVTNASSSPAWAAGVTYGQGQVVGYSGIAYASLQNGNTNNAPPSPAWWSAVATRMTIPPMATAPALLDAIYAAVIALGVQQNAPLPASADDVLLLSDISACLLGVSRLPGYVSSQPPLQVAWLVVP